MKNSEVAKSFYRHPYEHCTGSNFFVENKILYSYGHHFPVAIHLKGNYVLLNGDTYSRSTGTHQGYARRAIPSDEQIIIPFSALERMLGRGRFSASYAWDKYAEINVIDSVESTMIEYTYKNSKGEEKTGYHHTLGGSVFELDGRFFISGIDPSGSGTLYFLTELVRTAENFEDALEALKPEEVREAESADIEVKRQGEWFFIKKESFTAPDQLVIKEGKLPDRNGGTGHHTVSELANFSELWFARGVVKHDNHDHKQLKLYDDVKQKSWWKAIGNEQKGSWSAGGNVD